MRVTLPTDLAAIAARAVKSGDFASVDDFVSMCVRARNAEPPSGAVAAEDVNGDADPAPYDQWRQRFQVYLQGRRQAPDVDLDDSRESIYPEAE
jgi:Arc/MetJ-type ribon-helix-helix transcriptional regulator